ncbi:preprotein translocase subunit SecA [bacterium]|nr:preprotein translocase subunit SecA [bacterium]
MAKILEKIFGTSSQRQVKKIMPLLDEIDEFYEEYHSISDDELRSKTILFRKKLISELLDFHKEIIEIDSEIAKCDDIDEIEQFRDEREKIEDELYIRESEILDEIMPEAFAVVKETCRRLVGTEFNLMENKVVWDMIPYDVQILGAIILHRGNIAEMATGEGKTLVATMPLYLNALAINHNWFELALNKWGENIDDWQFIPLTDEKNSETITPGRGAHLVTVNDYLARRDASWMGQIYNYLGLTVGVIYEGIEPYTPRRKAQYFTDISYGTNNAFGFDYLRDNMAVSPDNVVQREHFYSIIDEVDSVLIDEARTPLIISGPVESTISEQFKKWNPAVRHLASQQARFSARLISEGKKLWDKATMLDEEGKGKDANIAFQEATLKFLLVKRSTPKNPQFLKLIKQPEIFKSANRLEGEYQTNKKISELDEQLYFSVDERENSINLTDKGRDELGRYANVDKEVFILPDIADEFSQLEGDESLSEKDKQSKKEKIYKNYSERGEINHAITQLLKAYIMFAKDVDYVIQQGKVVIVDEFTGRLMPGRRYSEGLHQALEAKENVRVEGETQTYATITLQNYFRMYHKLAGMTGTAATEANELWEIYKLDVVTVPTNRPVRREDYNDRIYLTRKEKFNAVIDEIELYHKQALPVLVGTVSVDTSELLKRMLDRRKIPSSVLNAKHHEKEAEIVARAGQPYAVTIATNMAGRGTDIKLGVGIVKAYKLVFEPIVKKIVSEVEQGKSFLLVAENGEVTRNLVQICKDEYLEFKEFNLRDNAPETVSKYLSERGKVAIFSGFELSKAIPSGDYEIKLFPKPNCALYTKISDEWTCPANPKECFAGAIPCGLHIIGTERHEARRIDNQLRGRAGRQGDPGASRFFLSLQDDLMRLYAGGDRAYNMIKRLNPPEGEPIEHKIISGQISKAQKRVEGQNFSIRKRLLEYDDVMNRQREVIYSMRKNILFGKNLKPEYKRFIKEFCEDLVDDYTDADRPPESWDWKIMSEEFTKIFLVKYNPDDPSHPSENLVEEIYQTALGAYNLKENFIGDDVTRRLERAAMLATIDQLWKEHLRALDDIKEGSYLMAYAQKDPLIVYKKEAFDAFEKLIYDIRGETLMKFFHARVVAPTGTKRQAPLRAMHSGVEGYGAAETAAMAQRVFGKGAQDRAENPTSGNAPTPLMNLPNKSAKAHQNNSGKPRPIRRGKKIGRNDPCPCGSGKKYKNCCGKKQN